MRFALATCLALAACTSGTPPTHPDAGANVERGPKAIPVEGDANGLWWDAASATLYLADDNNNRILKWTDEGGIAVVGSLPPAPANGAGLGQLVRTSDGTLVVVRFGHGTAGDVVFVSPDGTSGVVPNLAPDRRRIGLTITPEGTLYDCYFVRNGNLNIGSVAQLTLSGSETELIGGLGKAVGVLAIGNDLLVSDQTNGKVLRAPVANPAGLSTFAAFANPDLLAAGPNGSLFTGSKDGKVYQLSAKGEVTVFSSGYQQVRGMAYDAANRRLFLADHDGEPSNGLNNFLQIVPVP